MLTERHAAVLVEMQAPQQVGTQDVGTPSCVAISAIRLASVIRLASMPSAQLLKSQLHVAHLRYS